MKNNYEILPVLPIPLFACAIPNSLSKIIPFLNNQKLREINPSTNEYGRVSSNTYILDEPECFELRGFILNQVLEYGSKYLGYASSSYKITQSWISIKEPGQFHNVHTHSNSVISGVLYYGKYPQDTSAIVFHRHSTSTNVTNSLLSADLNYNYNNDSPLVYNENCAYSPIPGGLIIFPSSLPHSVPQNETNFPRKSLAFNAVPTEGFGNEESLNELKFN